MARRRGDITVDLRRPSEIGAAQETAWRGFMAATPSLGRAFLSLRFARAAEAAHGRARVAVLRDAAGIAGFLAVEFASAWHEAIGLAGPVGGGLADHAGLVTRPGFGIAPAALLHAAGLGGYFAPQLSPGQEAFGFAGQPARLGHVIDLSAGPEAYFAALEARDRPFFQDTARRARRLAREYGVVELSFLRDPPAAEVLDLVAAKRAQYERTQVGDPLAGEAARRLLLALAQEGDATCRLLLSRLTVGGKVLARHLGLLHRGTLSYWFPVYDPEARRMSPGRMLLWHTIGAAAAEGITLIDRGGGDSPAKRDFSTGTVQFAAGFWQAPTPRGVLARLGQALAWRLAR
jgi:CelD/BcsL family acetyltransferase involved in cellulose biosynthesis